MNIGKIGPEEVDGIISSENLDSYINDLFPFRVRFSGIMDNIKRSSRFPIYGTSRFPGNGDLKFFNIASYIGYETLTFNIGNFIS